MRRGFGLVPHKQQLTLRIDADVLSWFRLQGSGYQTRSNQLLRACMQAHRPR
ncbi:MAG: BrnA antitoxin family protein [Acidobacteriia bacterium]|nr:BrnA antitoxin family protein [Terriglobia bacterium]